MRSVQKVTYWVLVSVGVAIWTGLIMALTNLPLPTELALGGMGVVAGIWGHSVFFPKVHAVAEPAAAARAGQAARAPAGLLPVGTARIPVSRSARPPAYQAPHVAPLTPPPVPQPTAEEIEGARLAEAITATGLFGPVGIRIEPEGICWIAPPQQVDGVRLPVATVTHFAANAQASSRLTFERQRGGGAWPGRDLEAAMEAHLAAIAPAPQYLTQLLHYQPDPAPRPAAYFAPPAWDGALGHLLRRTA